MPFAIIKKDDSFVLRNKITGKIVNKKFKTRQSAKNASLNYMRYEKRNKRSR